MELGIVDYNVNIEELQEDLSKYLRNYYNVSVDKIDLGNLFTSVLFLSRKYHMKIPEDYVLLAKAIGTLEGFARSYYPEINVVKIYKPIIEEIILKRKSPIYMFNTLKNNVVDFVDTIKSLPYEVKKALMVVEKGEIKLEVEDRDIKRFAFELDKSSNRIAYGVILASLIVASSLLAKTSPAYLFGLPIISLIFLAIALFIAITLVISIGKEGEVLK